MKRFVCLCLALILVFGLVPQMPIQANAYDADYVLGPKVYNYAKRDFVWPVDATPSVQSCFYDWCGVHPKTDYAPKGNHFALDLNGAYNTPIKAVYAGVVVDKNKDAWGSGFGTWLIMRHDYLGSDGKTVRIAGTLGQTVRSQ